MKECWINVYPTTAGVWYGNYWPDKYFAELGTITKPIYRIHVRMK